MRRWFYMLGGLLIWAVHFVGVYTIASIGDVVARAEERTWRMIGLAFSGLCLLAVAALLIQSLRSRDNGTEIGDLGNTLDAVRLDVEKF